MADKFLGLYDTPVENVTCTRQELKEFRKENIIGGKYRIKVKNRMYRIRYQQIDDDCYKVFLVQDKK